MTKKYKCLECGWVGTEDEMDCDYILEGWDEMWSNWICPSCNTWQDLEDYEEIKMRAIIATTNLNQKGDIFTYQVLEKFLKDLKNNKNPVITVNFDSTKVIGKFCNPKLNYGKLSVEIDIPENLSGYISVGYYVKDALYDKTEDKFYTIDADLIELSLVAKPMDERLTLV